MTRDKAIGGLLLVVVVATAGGFLALKYGTRELADRVGRDVGPLLRAHLGTVERIELDLAATREQENEQVFVFDVVGSKDEGVLTVEWVDHAARSGTLRTKSGEVHDLFPENAR